ERASVNEERGFLQRGSRGRGEIERGPEERGDRRRGGLEGAARHLGELESEARKGARRDAADERGEDDEAAGAPELARQGAQHASGEGRGDFLIRQFVQKTVQLPQPQEPLRARGACREMLGRVEGDSRGPFALGQGRQHGLHLLTVHASTATSKPPPRRGSGRSISRLRIARARKIRFLTVPSGSPVTAAICS